MILYRSARESGTNAPVAQLDRVTDYESVGQGFESLPAYQKNRYPIRDDGFSYMSGGTRKDGRAKRGKKVSGGHFFSPWESPLIWGRIRYGCGPESNPNHASKSDTFGCPIFFIFGIQIRIPAYASHIHSTFYLHFSRFGLYCYCAIILLPIKIQRNEAT